MKVALESTLRRDAEVIGLISLAHGTSHFYHLLLPSLFPWLMGEFGLSFTQAGFLMTVFFVVSGIGQALAGFVVDRHGARPVLFFGVGMLAVCGVVLGLADSYAGLIVAAAVAGVGNSIFHPADFTLLNRRVSTPRLGHAFSMHGLAGNLGWAAAPVFMVGIAAFSNWHVAAFAAAAVGAVVLVLLWLRRRVLDDVALAAVVARPANTGAVAGAGQLAFLRVPSVWMCFTFFLFATGAFGILQSFAPALLGELYGLSIAAASFALTAYLLGASAGTLAGGFAAAKASSERVIAVALGSSALFATLLATSISPPWAAAPLMALVGFGVGVAGPSRDLLVRRAATARFGKASFGRVYGFVYSGLDLGLALTPLAFGPLLDAGHYQITLFGVAALQLLALASAMQVGRVATAPKALAGKTA